MVTSILFPSVTEAVAKTVHDACSKLLDEAQAYVLSKIDIDYQEIVDDIFIDFKKDFERMHVESEKVMKKSLKQSTKRKRKITPYNLFISEKMKKFKQEDTGLNGKEIMKKAMFAWRALSKEEQESIRQSCSKS